ncbi:MAG: MBL fold metallo-hydrolase, partial [Clostridia bacterium]|nr:MBL fold metallo-hydrolase [Clostridia bacterium]
MTVTTLVENTAINDNFCSEHGLSLYIEVKGLRILFDMGQTELFAENAEKLGIDLENVDIAVISHGHYDHGGGLKKFLEINKKAPVYISRFAFEPHYNGSEKYIGL